MRIADVNKSSSPTVEPESLAAARSFESVQQWASALDEWNKVLEQSPSSFEAHIGKADALIALEEFEQATDCFHALANKWPQHPRGLNGLAQIAYITQQWELVIERCDVLLKNFPQNLQGHAWKANAYFELGQFNRAESIFSYLARTYPNHIRGRHGLAKIAIRNQQWQLAIERCADLQAKFPEHFQGYAWQANAYLKLKKFEQAEKTFSRLSRQYPESIIGFDGLARTAFYNQQWELALERCEILQQRFPQHSNGYALQGDILIEQRQFEQAATLFERLSKSHTDTEEGLKGLARIAMLRQQWPLALERLTAVIKKFPQDVTSYLYKVDAYNQLEDFKRAEALMKKVAARYPIKPSMLRGLTAVANHTQHWDFTVNSIKTFIQQNSALCATVQEGSNLLVLLNRLFRLMLDSGEFSRVQTLLSCLEAQNVPPERILIWRSQLIHHQGDYTASKAMCLAAIQQYPQFIDSFRLQLARFAWQEFDLSDVLSLCTQVSSAEESIYVDSQTILVMALIRLDELRRAKDILQKLIEQYPTKISAYIFLVEILCFHDRDYVQTLAICNHAESYNIADDRLYCYKSIALCKLGNIAQALELLANYARCYPENRLILMAQSQTLRQHRDSQGALARLNDWLAAGSFAPVVSTGPKQELNVQYLKCEPGYVVNREKKVSVIMTTYRRDKLLPVAIASILHQTYQNIELIIVDDCSPDDTYDYIETVAQSDSRIRTLQLKQNSGTYVAKNHGLAISEGAYIAFMDSDDWLHPQTIEKQVDLLENSESLAVMCGFFRVDEESNIEFKPEGPAGQAHITLCFKRDPVFTTLGYFDAVRTGADTEHLERLQWVFGSQKVKRIKFPVLVSTRHSRSITGGSSDLGFPWYGPGRNDSLYAASFRKWHRQVRHSKQSPFIPHPITTRKFVAPEALLPQRYNKTMPLTNIETIETVADCLQQAKKAQQENQWERALATYKRAIEIDANCLEAWQALGNYHFAQKDYDSALNAYISAVRISPKVAFSHFRLGRIAELQNRLEDAAASYGYAIYLDAKNIRFYEALGRLQFAQKQFSWAIDTYRKAAELGSKSPVVHFRLGRIAHKQEDIESAAKWYKSAIALNDRNPQFYYHLGNAQAEQSDIEQAKASYKKALSLDSNHQNARRSLRALSK